MTTDDLLGQPQRGGIKALRYAVLMVTILYWLFILLMTHLPKPPHIGPQLNDKQQHFIGYGILASLMYLSLWATRPRLRWDWLYAMAIVLAYGALDEWTQPLTGRTCDIYDWLADFAGVAAAVAVLAALRYCLIACRIEKR